MVMGGLTLQADISLLHQVVPTLIFRISLVALSEAETPQ